jgi:hypothetical protein
LEGLIVIVGVLLPVFFTIATAAPVATPATITPAITA